MKALVELNMIEIQQIFTIEKIGEDLFRYLDGYGSRIGVVYDDNLDNRRDVKFEEDDLLTIVSIKVVRNVVTDWCMLSILVGVGAFDESHGLIKAEKCVVDMHYNQDVELISVDLFDASYLTSSVYKRDTPNL